MQIKKLTGMLVLGALLAVVGCDDDDEDAPRDAGRRDAAVDARVRDATTDGARPDAATGTRTIAELATGTPELSVLAGAVTRADMATMLGGAGPLTVFAPTNEAFAAAGITPAMIQAMPVPQLQQLLAYHVIDDELTAAELRGADRRFVETMAENQWGLPMSVVLTTTGDLRVNDARVRQADIDAANGVVHQIDRVLVPPNVLQMAQFAGLTGLASAIGAASPLASGQTIAATLATEGPFTIFAPNEAAFAAAETLLGTLNPDEIRSVLSYHVLSPASYTEPVELRDFPTETGARLQTLLGPPAAVNATVTPPTVRDARIVEADVHVVNGTLHIIDGILLPPGISP